MINPADFKLLSSKLLHDGWLKLRQDEVLLPNNVKATYTYAEQRDAVIVVPLNDKQEVIMVEQYRVPLKQVFLEFPAGLMEAGETPIEAAKRELEEETGYLARKLVHMLSCYPTTGQMNFRLHLVFASGLVKTQQRLDETEFLNIKLVHVKQLKPLLDNGHVETSMLLAYYVAKDKGLIRV